MMAGRLTGTLDGRPVVIEADDSGLTLTSTTFGTAWRARRSAESLLPMLGVLKRCGVPVRLSIMGVVSVAVLPRPSMLAKLVVPGLVDLG
jgi:hypothetical protein